MSFVFIKRAGLEFESEAFAIVNVEEIATIGHLSELCCTRFPRWRADDAGQVKLFRAKFAGEDEPTAEEERTALITQLQVGWSLERAGIGKGAYLLAVVQSQPTQGR